MRSHLPWLTTGLFGLALLMPSVAGAQDDPTTTTTTPASAVEQTLPELAPGESPDGTEVDSGPTLTMLIPESTETTDVVPAGPVVFDPVASNAFDNNAKTVLFLLVLTAVPSLTVGTALWVHRDQALSRRS